MENSNKRSYALLANSQQDLDRFVGLRGVISDAPGMRGLTSLGEPQADGDYRLFGKLEIDSLGKQRDGESVADAIAYVTSHMNSVLAVTSVEQISDNITQLAEVLEEIHRAGSGIFIRFSSRALEHRFKTRGEHHGWIWIGDTLAEFIEQVRIAGDFSEMFHPNPWSKIPNSEIYEIWSMIQNGKSNVAISNETGVSQKTVAALKKRFIKLETIYRKV